MKKAIALLITVLMVFTLFACNSTPAPPATSSPPAGGSSAPAPSSSAPPVVSTPSVAPPAEEGDVAANANSIGFFMSGVDPKSRDTYNIAWMYMRPMAVFQNITDALVSMEPILNFKVTDYCANNDVDAYIQNVEIYASQDIDGFLVTIDATASARTCEVLDETGLPYIAMLNSVQDSNGSALVPCVGLDNYNVGERLTQWLYDNYKTYWGDIDETKIGLLDFNYSPNVDFNNRSKGALDRFNKLLPGNGDLVFIADGVTGRLDEQTGYDLASAILAANPQVEYWFIPACLELYAQAATRVVEQLGIDDKVLTTCCDSNVLTGAWETADYEGSWVSCIAISGYQYGVPGICGLVAILDGKATMETIWESYRRPTDKMTFFQIANEIVTKDTYEAYFKSVMSEAGLA